MTKPTPADPADVPAANSVTASPWAAYADGKWYRLDYQTDEILLNSRSRDVTAAGRNYARRNGLRWESRHGAELVRGLPRYVFVKMTPKTTRKAAK